MISKKLLKELQQIIKEEYGVELEPKEASNIGNTLVGFFELLAEINSGIYDAKSFIDKSLVAKGGTEL